jgi:hypothetical protein
MITLSVKNDPDLERQTKHLIASFRRLRQTVEWKSHVAGGATIIEIKYGVDGWHAHLHIFCYMRFYVYERLLRSWKKCSGGTAVYITKADENAMMYYVTKYVSKSELQEEFRPEASRILRGYRLFQRFGDWSQLKVPKHLSDAKCDACGKADWVFILHNNTVPGYSSISP